MDHNTPATAIRPKDLAANCLALGDCLRAVPPSAVRTILDVRYGLGGWARAALRRFPAARLVGYEADTETAARAWRDGRVDLRVGRFPGSYAASGVCLTLCDFNTTTALKRALLDEAVVAAARPLYLVFTDVACTRLHLNYARSYGLREPSLDEYWNRFPLPGYRLVRHSRRHWGASTALWKRKSPG